MILWYCGDYLDGIGRARGEVHLCVCMCVDVCVCVCVCVCVRVRVRARTRAYVIVEGFSNGVCVYHVPWHRLVLRVCGPLEGRGVDAEVLKARIRDKKLELLRWRNLNCRASDNNAHNPNTPNNLDNSNNPNLRSSATERGEPSITARPVSVCDYGKC